MMSELEAPFTLPLLEWVDIPGGSVTLAGDAGTFAIQPFQIAKYPVTNAQFTAFIQDKGYKNDRWWEGLAQHGGAPRASDFRDADAPKLEVCWYEAVAFSRWLGSELQRDVRLPTEWEWQWAAVGDSGWDYPYGSAFDSRLSNTKESGIAQTNSVTAYASVASPFGAVDMSGNVWEWCLNEGAIPQNIQISGSENRALRGGSWNNNQDNARASFRSHRSTRTRTFNIGFRVMIAL